MAQTIYSLIAIALVMILSLNLFRATTSTEQRMIINEVATQVTGLTVDLMEHVGNRWFDENTSESGIEPGDFPLVTSAAMLTPSSGFGNIGEGATCDHATPDFYDLDCNDIDDFHGMTIQRSVEGLQYTADITVRYVDPNNPDAESGGQTFAKEVVIRVVSPNLTLGGDPLEVELSRVFTYNRITANP